jgi:hypothetical protein
MTSIIHDGKDSVLVIKRHCQEPWEPVRICLSGDVGNVCF